MLIVSLGDNLHAMSKPIFGGKKKRNTMQRPYNADHFTSDISLTWLISGCHFFLIKIQKIVKKKCLFSLILISFSVIYDLSNVHQLPLHLWTQPTW